MGASTIRVSVKAGLWTVDRTMDWTVDCNRDWNLDWNMDWNALLILSPKQRVQSALAHLESQAQASWQLIVMEMACSDRSVVIFTSSSPSPQATQEATTRAEGKGSTPAHHKQLSVTAKESTTHAEGERSTPAHHKQLSVTAKECNMSTLPFATLDAMWTRAEVYLPSINDVLPAPGSDRKSKKVASRSGSTPHFVRVVSPGHYVCDKNCLQWSSSQICSHTLVVAEVNGELELFLQWYIGSGQESNITRLAQAGLRLYEDERVEFPSESVASHPLLHQISSFHAQQQVQSVAHSRMQLESSERLKRTSLLTTISTSHVSKLYLRTLFPPVSLFHLMYCQC